MLNVQENKNDSEAYYMNQKQKLLKEFDKGFKHCKKAIDQHQKDLDTDRIYREGRNEFIRLIPEIPYIGGKKNSLTWNLVGSVMLLAMIRALEKEGISERDFIIKEIKEKSMIDFESQIELTYEKDAAIKEIKNGKIVACGFCSIDFDGECCAAVVVVPGRCASCNW